MEDYFIPNVSEADFVSGSSVQCRHSSNIWIFKSYLHLHTQVRFLQSVLNRDSIVEVNPLWVCILPLSKTYTLNRADKTENINNRIHLFRKDDIDFTPQPHHSIFLNMSP